jgi:hypothetical protein
MSLRFSLFLSSISLLCFRRFSTNSACSFFVFPFFAFLLTRQSFW